MRIIKPGREPKKEIALKVANRYNDPEETAKYAAKAAKQIVKHLKEK